MNWYQFLDLRAQAEAKGLFRWDFWPLVLADEVRIFCLEAEATEDPDERHHHHVRIRELKTTDGQQFLDLGIVLQPSPNFHDWDSLALWTGHTFREGGLDYLFYTGRSAEQFWIQRIGLALRTGSQPFEKQDGFLLEADGDLYCNHDQCNSLGVAPAFRDPFVLPVPGGGYQMLFAARDARRQGPYNACIGRALSSDLKHWELRPPLLSPGIYGQMECPQLLATGRGWILIFSLWAQDCHPKLQRRVSGLYGYESLEGVAFKPLQSDGILNDQGMSVYAQRMFQYQGQTFAAGFINQFDGVCCGGFSPWVEVSSNSL